LQEHSHIIDCIARDGWSNIGIRLGVVGAILSIGRVGDGILTRSTFGSSGRSIANTS